MKKIIIMFSVIFSLSFIGSGIFSDRLIDSDEILMRMLQSLTFALLMFYIHFLVSRKSKNRKNTEIVVLRNKEGIAHIKALLCENSKITLKEESNTRLVYSKTTNLLLSFGEIITLDFYTENDVDLMKIQSKSLFSLTILDFGINSSNVSYIHDLI